VDNVFKVPLTYGRSDLLGDFWRLHTGFFVLQSYFIRFNRQYGRFSTH